MGLAVKRFAGSSPVASTEKPVQGMFSSATGCKLGPFPRYPCAQSLGLHTACIAPTRRHPVRRPVRFAYGVLPVAMPGSEQPAVRKEVRHGPKRNAGGGP
jgi:hypothetical protein